jgi:CDGSH-type Zn-finger protein
VIANREFLCYVSFIMNNPEIADKKPLIQDMEPGVYFWCSCGKSSTQPLCDGSHKGSGFAPRKVEITETKKVAFCMCKHSKNGAMCDGSHSGL